MLTPVSLNPTDRGTIGPQSMGIRKGWTQLKATKTHTHLKNTEKFQEYNRLIRNFMKFCQV